MRLLLLSTPRSGNTWFRRLLAGALHLADFAVHRPEDLDWSALPANCIVQMHWRVRPQILRIISEFQLRPVLIVRHPLDVLISILHFCTFEPQTACWLGGEGGDESMIKGKAPTDPAFVAYTTGPRASALLAVSAEWAEAGVEYVRYEDLVARTAIELEAFFARLSVQPIRDLTAVITANTLDKARLGSENFHFWQGTPGIGSRLIGKDLALRIQSAHPMVFETLGYRIESASELTVEEIKRSWNAIA